MNCHGNEASRASSLALTAETVVSDGGRWVVLGCGSSAGTPVVGCQCAVCRSDNPRNCRTRCSAYVQIGRQAFLVDTGPDLRYQALRERITQVNAVLYTHPHADHLNGIDDLRAFCHRQQRPIPLYGNPFTIDNIRSRFDYALLAPSAVWDKPVLTPIAVEGPFQHGGVSLIPIPLNHGRWPCTGWRLGNAAWLTDLSSIPPSSLPFLEGLHVLFLDCLRNEPYPSHLSVTQSFLWAERIGAQRTILIHMTHELDHQALSDRCPAGIEVAYDGLVVTL